MSAISAEVPCNSASGGKDGKQKDGTPCPPFVAPEGPLDDDDGGGGGGEPPKPPDRGLVFPNEHGGAEEFAPEDELRIAEKKASNEASAGSLGSVFGDDDAEGADGGAVGRVHGAANATAATILKGLHLWDKMSKLLPGVGDTPVGPGQGGAPPPGGGGAVALDHG